MVKKEDVADDDEENRDVAKLEKAAKLIQSSGGFGGTRMTSEYLTPVSRFKASA